jgi:phospholipid N-methyltransferase
MEFNRYTKRRFLPSQTLNKQVSLFARNFIKHPKMLGSIIPSSPFLVEHMLAHMAWEKAKVLVEYGPGVGTFTQEMLQRMRPDAVLLVLETNEDFVEFLESAYPDPRLEIVHRSAEDIEAVLEEKGLGSADYIVSGIPLSTLSSDVKEGILRSTQRALTPSGAFLLYQFSPSILPHLRKVFSNVQRNFVPLNLLPAHFYYCTP